VAIVPIAVLIAIFQERVVGGLTQGGLKGDRHGRQETSLRHHRCGSMGREHIENIRAMGGAVVTAVADPTAASRQQASELLDGRCNSSRITSTC